jgi:glycolate oxidase iron-sulfur subunit
MIDILQAADRCVVCGLCLPHCPTYGKTRHEADSPRGRIALMRALERAALPGEGTLIRHLDGCLGCRACEAVCPAGVPYGELIDATRARLSVARRRRFDPARWCTDVFIRWRGPRVLAYWLLLIYQRFGVQKVARKSGLLRIMGLARAESLLPQPAHASRLPAAKPRDESRPTVALFTGCAGEIFDRATLAASQELLTRFGYNVLIPRRQTCCGALHQHAGAAVDALKFMKRNVAAFDLRGVEAVISTATGCGAQLAEYARHVDGEVADRFAQRHADICRFLAAQRWPASLKLQPLAARVVVHTPCSLRYPLKQTEQAAKLLGRVPDLKLVGLTQDNRCCGAAGSYMLREPQMADALLADQIEQIKALRPDILTTSSVGCALHLQAGLRRAGLDVPVLHPVTLLHGQLARE